MTRGFALVATVDVAPRGRDAIVTVAIEPADREAFEEAVAALPPATHAYLGRLRVASGGTSRERWWGSDGSISGSAAIDEVPLFPAVSCPAPGRVDVEVAFRMAFHDDGPPFAEVQAAGAIAVSPPFPARARVPLLPVDAGADSFDGPPFLPPAAVDAPAAAAAPLPATAASIPIAGPVPLATLPDVGILAHGPPGVVSLIAPDGVRPLPGFPPIHRFPSYDLACTAGVGGTLAMVWGDTNVGLKLSTFGPPALRRRHEYPRRPGQVFVARHGRIDPTGRWLIATVDHRQIAAFDLEQGTIGWRRKLHADLHDLAIAVGHASLVVAGRGELRELDLASGAERRRAWLPEIDRGALGVGASGRVAWTHAFTVSPSPLGAVAWQDPGGAGGQVAVPDALIEPSVAVLGDGRIVAVGEATWLVDPERGTTHRIAGRLALPERPLVTRGPSGDRVWTLDPACWHLDLPPRVIDGSPSAR